VTVTAVKAGYAISPTSRTAILWRDIRTKVTFKAATANGAAETGNSTKITLKFSADIPGLTAADITLVPGKGSPKVTKGKLTRESEGVYDLTISGSWDDGDKVDVKIAKAGFDVDPDDRSVTLHKDVRVKADYDSAKADGKADKETSSKIVLQFSKEIKGLQASDVRLIVTGNARVEKGALRHVSGGTYQLSISGSWNEGAQVKVEVERTGYNITPSERSTKLHRVSDKPVEEVDFIEADVDGNADSGTTKEITFIFDKEIPGLSADDVIVVAPNGIVIEKGALIGSESADGRYTYRLAITGTWDEGTKITVSIAKSGVDLHPATQEVTLHRNQSQVSYMSAIANGEPGKDTSTKIILIFDQDVALSIANITLTPIGNAIINGGALTRISEGVYELTITGEWTEGDEVSVAITVDGSELTPESQIITLHYGENDGGGSWSLFNLLTAIASLLLAGVLFVLRLRRHRNAAGSGPSTSAFSFGLWLASVILGVLAGAIWIIFDDLSGPMVWFNWHTIFLVVIIVLQAAFTVFNTRTRKTVT
jgi:hypothetical protein